MSFDVFIVVRPRYGATVATNTCSINPEAVWAPTLFDAEPIEVDERFTGAHRYELSHGAWLEYTPGWLRGAAGVFDDLVENVPWQSGRRLMYGRFVDDPRLHAFRRE